MCGKSRRLWCVSVGSRKVRLGKFGQDGLGLMRRGTERCGLVGHGG
jgi:hypothetical protein